MLVCIGSNTLKHTVFDYDAFQIYTNKYHSAGVLQILFVFEKQFLINCFHYSKYSLIFHDLESCFTNPVIL